MLICIGKLTYVDADCIKYMRVAGSKFIIAFDNKDDVLNWECKTQKDAEALMQEVLDGIPTYEPESNQQPLV